MKNGEKNIPWISIIFTAFVLVGIILVWILKSKLMLGDKIQATAVLLLVSITMFYAEQTYKLAREQNKVRIDTLNKNMADYGEIRIEKFHLPLINYFERFISKLDGIAEDIEARIVNGREDGLDQAWEALSYVKEIINAKNYMAEMSLRSDLHKFSEELEWPSGSNKNNEYIAKWKKETILAAQGLQARVQSEKVIIETIIQITFGYFVDNPVSLAAKEIVEEITKKAKATPLDKAK